MPLERLFDNASLTAERFPHGRGPLVDNRGEFLAGRDKPDLVACESPIDRIARQAVPHGCGPLVDDGGEILSGRDEPGLMPLERLIDGSS